MHAKKFSWGMDCIHWMRGYCREEACSFKHEDGKKVMNSNKRGNSFPNEGRDSKKRKDDDVEDIVSRLMESFLVRALGGSNRPNPPVQASVWDHPPQTSAWTGMACPQLWDRTPELPQRRMFMR